MELEERMKELARELHAIAQTGLAYGRDVYDKERYDAVNRVSQNLLALISDKDIQEIGRLLPIESGYATPKVAVRGLIRDGNKVLMVKESADGLWTLPGGWCDIGLTPAENIIKEVQEETGLHVKVNRLIALFDQTKHRESVTLQHIYTVYFLCDVLGGTLGTSVETTEVAFFDYDNLPELSEERMTIEQFNLAYNIAKNDEKSYFE